jgi:hypothetical protein
VLWLVIEVAVYFAATPFPATRRTMGIVVVATLVCGYLLRRSGRGQSGESVLRWVVTIGCLLGTLFWTVDLLEARSQERGVRAAQRELGAQGSQERIWFVGHWGFQFYAERAGMLPVVPDRSRLSAGDWLVVPDRVDQQEIRVSDDDVELHANLVLDAGLPATTGRGYYGGSTPLSHLEGPRLQVGLYRVKRSFVPSSSWSVARLVRWARGAGGRTAGGAVPALARVLREADADDRWSAAEALAGLGPLAVDARSELTNALADPSAAVRYWCAVALGRLDSASEDTVLRLEARLQTETDNDVRNAVADALRRLGE